MTGWEPQPGDPVVIVRTGGYLEGVAGLVATYEASAGSAGCKVRLGPTAAFAIYVQEVRPLTPEESTTYWTTRGAQ